MMRKENLVGQIFGKLTVISELQPEPGKPKRPRWECLCECRNTVIVLRGTDLKSGNTVSCGCWRAENAAKRTTKRNTENKKYEPEMGAAMRIFKTTYNDGDLTFEQFLQFVRQNCFYCGIEPINLARQKRKRNPKDDTEYAMFTYNGIDRKDSKLPHNFDNCVTCCCFCNWAKRDRSVEEFIKWVQLISTHLINKNLLIT